MDNFFFLTVMMCLVHSAVHSSSWILLMEKSRCRWVPHGHLGREGSPVLIRPFPGQRAQKIVGSHGADELGDAGPVPLPRHTLSAPHRLCAFGKTASLSAGLTPSEVIHLNSEYFSKKLALISFWLNFIHCKVGYNYSNANFKSLG